MYILFVKEYIVGKIILCANKRDLVRLKIILPKNICFQINQYILLSTNCFVVSKLFQCG